MQAELQNPEKKFTFGSMSAMDKKAVKNQCIRRGHDEKVSSLIIIIIIIIIIFI